MIDVSVAHDCHRLETAVWVLREPGHDAAVVHAPAIFAFEILAKLASREGSGRPQALIGRWIRIVMVDTEKERVGSLPGKPERLRAKHVVGHANLQYSVLRLAPTLLHRARDGRDLASMCHSTRGVGNRRDSD